MKITILSVADDELGQAIHYYEREQVGLGKRFHHEVSQAIGRIADYPKAYAFIGARTRRCLVATFPYGILYQYKEHVGEVVTVAIGHLHRKPDYWVSR